MMLQQKNIFAAVLWLLVCFGASTTAHAQDSPLYKGLWSIGGTLSGNSYSTTTGGAVNAPNTNNNQRSTFNFLPTVMYFISPKMAIGGGIGYSSYRYANKNVYNANEFITQNITGYDIPVSFGLRRYFPVYNNKLFARIDASLNIGFGVQKTESTNQRYDGSGYPAITTTQETKTTSGGINASASLEYFFTPHFALSLGTNLLNARYNRGYDVQVYNEAVPRVSNGFSIDFTGSPSVGLAYLYFSGAYYFGKPAAADKK